MAATPLVSTDLAGLPVRRGKVRDVYDLGDMVLLVATDRLSAFDWVLPTGVPDKGRVLTQISRFWFDQLRASAGVAHHLITTDVAAMPLPAGADRAALAGRTMLCRKSEVVPFECVVRGYLSGSAWKEYCETGAVCGERLPSGLRESDPLPQPIFTPATKAEQGAHDENVPFARMVNDLGPELAGRLKAVSLAIYVLGAIHAQMRGVLIADTKFEFGLLGDELLVIDEVLTPDSSRFWPVEGYSPGGPQPSYDKQFVRDWLTSSGWDKNSPPPELPPDIVAKTRAKYIEAYERLTGEAFAWR